MIEGFAFGRCGIHEDIGGRTGEGVAYVREVLSIQAAPEDVGLGRIQSVGTRGRSVEAAVVGTSKKLGLRG